MCTATSCTATRGGSLTGSAAITFTDTFNNPLPVRAEAFLLGQWTTIPVTGDAANA
jgi:hypothetical protein